MRRCRNVADGELYALCLLGISPRETANRIHANASAVSDTVARPVGATDAVGTQAKVQRGTYRALGVAGAAPTSGDLRCLKQASARQRADVRVGYVNNSIKTNSYDALAIYCLLLSGHIA